jgi:hypothetical protein
LTRTTRASLNSIYFLGWWTDGDDSGTHTECTTNNIDSAFAPLAQWLRCHGRQALNTETVRPHYLCICYPFLITRSTGWREHSILCNESMPADRVHTRQLGRLSRLRCLVCGLVRLDVRARPHADSEREQLDGPAAREAVYDERAVNRKKRDRIVYLLFRRMQIPESLLKRRTDNLYQATYLYAYATLTRACFRLLRHHSSSLPLQSLNSAVLYSLSISVGAVTRRIMPATPGAGSCAL